MATSEEIIVNAILAGTREYLANAQKVAAANTEIAGSQDLMSRSADHATRRSYLMNQALFTVRRLLYATTLGFIAAGGAAIKMGFDYNNAMQTARIALRPFFEDNQQLTDALNRLWTIAKYTPFQIADMTTAFRALYPPMRTLGIGANEVIDTINALINGLSVAGKISGPALNRVTIALQHLAFQGRLTGISVNQLAKDGIPIFAILRKEFGLTADQLHNIAKMGIPADAVMRAITHYLNTTPGYADAAMRQARGSLIGIWSTFKDNISRMAGLLEQSVFMRLQNRLDRMNNWFNKIQAQIGEHPKIVTVLEAAAPALVGPWRQLTAVLRDFWIILSVIVHDLTHSQLVWGTIYLGLLAIHGVLAFLVPQMHALMTVAKILLPIWIAWHVYLKLNAIWLGINAFEEAVLTKRTSQLTFAQMLWRMWLLRSIAAERIAAATTFAYTWATTLLTTALYRARIAAASFAVALDLALGPVGWIILAVTALIVILVTLYFKWKAFHDLVNNTARFIWRNWTTIGLAFGPLIYVLVQVIKHFREIISVATRAAHIVRKGFGWFGNAFHRATSWIPGLAGGGTVTRGGLVMTGESGPELLSLPTGASVMPLTGPAAPVFNRPESWMHRGEDRQPIILKIGERVIESIVVDLNTGRLARA